MKKVINTILLLVLQKTEMIVNVLDTYLTSFFNKLKLGKLYVVSYTFLLTPELNNIPTIKELRI